MNSIGVIQSGRRSAARSAGINALLVVAGSVAVALSAQVALPLPFTAVPVTAQSLAVLLVGALLGWKCGSAALLVYLGEGAVGLPVFAGGSFGVAHLLGPTGGYLLGFVPAAAVAGWIAPQRGVQRSGQAVAAMLAGTVVIFTCGVAWLSMITGVKAALLGGLVPFLPGALLKLALGSALLPAGWRVLNAMNTMRWRGPGGV